VDIDALMPWQHMDVPRDAVGLVEHAVLLGAPVSVQKNRFMMARSAVSGRFVNAYSITDWLLALCCRYVSECVYPQSSCSIDVITLD
jgi:Protein of unknown function (DUF726)